MWQSSTSKAKPKRSLERRIGDRNSPLHIHRVAAEIQLAMPANYTPPPGEVVEEEPSIHTRLLLNDMSQTGIGLYAPIPFLPGQEIIIRLQEPRPFFLRGRVVWCREYSLKTNILSADPYNYRVGIRFVFESLEEERMVNSYCELIRREFIHKSIAA